MSVLIIRDEIEKPNFLAGLLPRLGIARIGNEINRREAKRIKVKTNGIHAKNKKIPWSRLCALHMRKHGIIEVRYTKEVDPYHILHHSTRVRHLPHLEEIIEGLTIVDFHKPKGKRKLINHDLAIRHDFLSIINHRGLDVVLKSEAFAQLKNSGRVNFSELEGHALQSILHLIEEEEHERLAKHSAARLSILIAGGEPYISILEKIDGYQKRAKDFFRMGYPHHEAAITENEPIMHEQANLSMLG